VVQLLAPSAILQVEGVADSVPVRLGLLPGGGLLAKLAVTVQAAVIDPVVYVLPDNEPLQPETELILYPLLGVTVKVVVEPLLTD
jgi:hypothetical protein